MTEVRINQCVFSDIAKRMTTCISDFNRMWNINKLLSRKKSFFHFTNALKHV